MNTEKVIEEPGEPSLSSLLAGISGEYFVAAELSRHGYIASITLRNSRGVDILASNSTASRSVAIQVKTAQGSKRTWIISSHAETFYSENQFYVFVNLNGLSGVPDYFIVPSKVVAEHITHNHTEWLARPGKYGQRHQDSPVRKFSDPEGQYLNRWDLLNL